MMEIGLIKWFDEIKGFGVITTASKTEVFLHISNWKDSKTINANNKLPIIFTSGLQRSKVTALETKYFNENSPEDWKILFSIKKHNFSIKLDYSEYNLLQIALDNLSTSFDTSILKSYFSESILNLTEDELFDKFNWVYKTYKNISIDVLKSYVFEVLNQRVNQLIHLQILRFWRMNILNDFKPSDLTFINTSNDLEVDELVSIENIETRNIIIIKKVKDLLENFNIQLFEDFDTILNTIDSESLKDKIELDLNKIASIHYLNIVNQKLEDTTKSDEVSTYTLKNILTKQPHFLDAKSLKTIRDNLESNIIYNCSFSTLIKCVNEGLLKVNNDFIKKKIDEISADELEELFNFRIADEEIVNLILERLFELNEHEKVLENSQRYSNDVFKKYDQLIYNTINEEEYFNFWKLKKGKILPENYLFKYINHNKDHHENLNKWILQHVITGDDTKRILLSIIKTTSSINNRYDFYTLFNAIKSLIKIEPNSTELILSSNNPYVKLILWHLKVIEEFDFETLKGKFIYFEPIDQVSIFKRLFYLKHTKQLDFNLEKLDQILRADLDLYFRNEQFNDDFVLDISTHIIIESIKAYVKTGDFVFESDLILKDLKNNSGKRFKIEHYFDKCEGRMTANWDWKNEGEISQVFFGADKFYYAIEFEPGSSVEGENYYGTYTYFQKNTNFEHLKEQVKKLPNRKWNPEKNHWGVPSSNKKEVYLFAKENRFFIKLEDRKHYDNNIHLVEYSRNLKDGKKYTSERNIPNGITFCEGRKANNKHYRFKTDFWWCANQECFQNCVKDHLTEEETTDSQQDAWEHYTLNDFLKILNINIDEYNGIDNIEDGNYAKFLGHINAFNRLLERLYCEECNNLLYPVKTSHFALYTDVRFHCIENNCSEKHKEVYLTNCLYGECKTIIDSRVSKSCAHGLYICDNCGTCCSEEFFKRRLDNLKKVGGYIHSALINNVENRDGHLEKKEYYCFKCSGMMTEGQNNSFNCTKCKVSYNLEKFKWLNKKWTQTHRRREDYPLKRFGENL